MRMLNTLAFDEYVQPTATAFYTPASQNDNLGRYDQLGLQVITDNANAAGSITAQIEHSADGRNWINKNGTAEVNGATVATGQTNVAAGSDTGSSPSLGFVRVRVQLTTTASAHVKIWVTGRDFGR